MSTKKRHFNTTHFLILILIFLFFASAVFAQGEESISITTYYPSPHGVYSTLRLYPKNVDPFSLPCSASNAGEIYYYSGNNQLYLCNGTNWVTTGGYWAALPSVPNDIYNTNIGNVHIGTPTYLADLQVHGAIFRHGSFINGFSPHTQVNLGINSRSYDFYTTIGGGYSNTVDGDNSVIAGGTTNTITRASNSVIVGGDRNWIYTPSVAEISSSFIGGGFYNSIIGAWYSAIVGGSNHHMGKPYSFIGGGSNNSILNVGQGAFIGGGINNLVDGLYYGFIGGGYNNRSAGDYGIIVGGRDNTVGSGGSMVGGNNNRASGILSFIGGGGSNEAYAAYYPIVVGGYSNKAGGEYSFIGGGAHNVANGNYSIIVGGYENLANGYFSWAGGYKARATHDGSFVWADSSSGAFASTAPYSFNIRAAGGAFLNGNSLADLAEFMDVSEKEEIKEAELVSLIGDDLLGKTKKPYAENLIGVISSKKTMTLHLGNSTSLDKGRKRLPVSLAGKCFVKVNAESGAIKLGDPITSSSLAGIGMKATKSGKIIGYAMEQADFKGAKEIKEILVFVNLGYYIQPEEYSSLRSQLAELKEEYLPLQSQLAELKKELIGLKSDLREGQKNE